MSRLATHAGTELHVAPKFTVPLIAGELVPIVMTNDRLFPARVLLEPKPEATEGVPDWP